MGLAHTTQNKNCCKIEEQLKGRINVKEDNAGNVYIYSNSVNNQQFCVTFAGSTLNRTDIGSVSTISKSEFDSISTTDVEQYA